MNGSHKKAATLCSLLLIITLEAAAADKVSLIRVTKNERQGISRILMDFSSLPGYRIQSSGERIDLVIRDTKIDPAFKALSEDGTIVKMVQKNYKNETNISFLLRRPPRQVEASFLLQSSFNKKELLSVAKPARLVLDILWDENPTVSTSSNHKTKSRLSIMSAAVGKPTIHQDQAASIRHIAAEYSGQWEKFFERYEVPVKIPVPLRYSLPPFPCLDLLQAIKIGKQPSNIISLKALGNAEEWDLALATLESIDIDKLPEKEQAQYLLIRGELLLRQEKFTDSLDMFTNLISNHTDAHINECARYLSVHARAFSGKPYEAAYELTLLRDEVTETNPLAPYLNLLQTEIALATGRADKAWHTLTDTHYNYAGPIKQLYTLRRADTLFASDKKDEAFAAYQEIQKYLDIGKDHLFSLAGLAHTLYQHGKYKEAIQYYNILTIALDGRSGQDLAFYAAVMSQLKSGDTKRILRLLNTIMETFPGTEGYFRARLKANDLTVLSGDKLKGMEAADEYGKIAEQAPLRELREEAAFKQALTLTLKGDRHRSVAYLQEFLRNYNSGTLYNDAQALLVELLPVVIKNKIKDKNYVQALVLAEQNRALLVSGRVSGDFLAELGLAFAGLWFWSRAVRVYLYMLDIAKGKTEEEKVYLPLVQALYEKGDYNLVEEYAGRFFRHFPKSKDLAPISCIRLRALQKNGQIEKAVRILRSRGLPKNRELHILAGKIFWELGEYDEVEKHLARVIDEDLDNAEADEVLLLAEALFRRGKGLEALPLYQLISKDNYLSDQAIYRLAQINIEANNTNEGLKLLNGLVEKANSPLWRKMAEETLAIEKF